MAVAADLPTLETLQAAVEQAGGKEPVNERLVIKFHRNGVDGSETTFRSGRGYRVVNVDGPFTRQAGKLDQQFWHTTVNGQSVLDQPDPGHAAKDVYETTVSRVSQPFDAYVIARLTKRGTGERDYIDPATFHIVRRERVTPAQTLTTTYDQFIAAGGYLRAWHWTTSDGTPADDGDYRIATAEVGGVTDDDIAIPVNRSIVVFPAGATSVDLPVSFHAGKFIVRLTVGGRGLDFILDTGAASILIDDDVARSLGLKNAVSHRNAANAGTFEQGTTVVPTMNVGPLTLSNVVVSTAPHSEEENPGTFRAVGLLGFDFIAGATLKLDYENQTVTAYEPASFVPPSDPHQLVLPIRLATDQPLTDVTVNGSLGERFVVDTGAANVGLLVFDYFARRYPQAISDAPSGGSGIAMSGVGGRINFVPFRANSVQISHLVFEDYRGFRVTGASYGGNEDGLLGPTFLHYFTVYIDYERSRLYLVPNKTGRAAMKIP